MPFNLPLKNGVCYLNCTPMKNIRALILNVLFFSVCIGCNHDNEATVPGNSTVNISIANNEIYTYDFELIGIEDNASLQKEPLHAKISSLTRNNNNHLVYIYQAKDNYTGTDEVAIEVCISDGSKCVTKHVTNLKFTITA
jgi:hypothetical protein